MIKEDYVSFEVAKLLKEKGFNEPCNGRYSYRGGNVIIENYPISNESLKYHPNIDGISAPTHQMAMKWLREKGFHINAPISYDYSVDADGNVVDKWTFWTFEILSSFSGELIYTEEVNEYHSYEDAVEAALKYCLENLI